MPIPVCARLSGLITVTVAKAPLAGIYYPQGYNKDLTTQPQWLIIPAMKESLAHLPSLKANKLELIAMNIRSLCDDVHMVVLFGSYARGDWKNGPHEQGIILYDSGRFKLARSKKLKPAELKRLAQQCFDEPFTSATEFYIDFDNAFKRGSYKKAAFELHQATEFASKTVLLVFGSECPQEHHLDILGDLAAGYRPEPAGILPRETDEEKEQFELLDYAYIGARYDMHYKITKQQLEQLSPCVKKLHEATERLCVAKIESFNV